MNDPVDKGGATNMGVTLATWRTVGYDKNRDGIIDSADVKLLTHDEAKAVCKRFYWDAWQADKICNQSVAEILVDWVWGSGKWGIIIPQRILNLNQDGVVGPITLAAVNNADSKKLHASIVEARKQFLNDIIYKDVVDKQRNYRNKTGRPMSQQQTLTLTNEKFRRGWFNRLADFRYSEF